MLPAATPRRVHNARGRTVDAWTAAEEIDMHEVPPNALVVVADGTGARVFRNQGDARAVSLHQFQLLELMNMVDDGPAGSAPAGATGYQHEKATFAKQLRAEESRGGKERFSTC